MTQHHPHSPFDPKHEAVIRRFMQLFAGSTRAHGQFTFLPARVGEKVRGEARTVHSAPRREHYSRHLYGTGPGLGIVPIRDDGSCVFGAIDFDDRTIDHAALSVRVARLGLPLLVCRSKSGGAHLYLFSEPVHASLMKRRLQSYRAALGMPDKTEIFPKQDELHGTEVGNWINLPYFGALCR